MPINTVTKDGFVSLIRKLDRRYSIPSRNYFSQVAIPKMYDTCRKTVESELGQIEHYACTTDLWSSRTTEPYISLTVHFLDQDFELKTRCLQTAYFPGEHTGENIACGLREALTSWNLREEQLACITTDNGSNVVKATELNHWVRLQCFGHRLHLAIGKCKLIVHLLYVALLLSIAVLFCNIIVLLLFLLFIVIILYCFLFFENLCVYCFVTY